MVARGAARMHWRCAGAAIERRANIFEVLLAIQVVDIPSMYQQARRYGTTGVENGKKLNGKDGLLCKQPTCLMQVFNGDWVLGWPVLGRHHSDGNIKKSLTAQIEPAESAAGFLADDGR
jgi:hypothetical protein